MDVSTSDPETQRMLRRANIDAALAEFTTLRAEAISRISAMQTVLTLQITVAGAIFSWALSDPGHRVPVMLVVPFTTCLLAMRYIGQHIPLRNISRYIQEHLDDRIPGGVGWEKWVNSQRFPVRALGWAGPLLVSFPGIALVSIVWFAVDFAATTRISGWTQQAGLIALWTIALIATIFTFWLVRKTFMWRLAERSIPAVRRAEDDE